MKWFVLYRLWVTYTKSPSFVGAAKQTWGFDNALQTLGGLVILFATKGSPEITWEGKIPQPSPLSNLACSTVWPNGKWRTHQAPCPLSPGWHCHPGSPPHAWKLPSLHHWHPRPATQRGQWGTSAQTHRWYSGWKQRPLPEETCGDRWVAGYRKVCTVSH